MMNNFNLLTQILYELNECEYVFVGGDMNARTGEKQDFIEDIDEISKRMPFDISSNKHGEVFLDFLKNTRYGILNGRVMPIYDNFMSILSKGTATVDYICTK